MPDPIPEVISKGDVGIGLKPIAKDLANPVTATFAPDDEDHLYVAEQNGKIWSVQLNLQDGDDPNQAVQLLGDIGALGLELGCFGIKYDERGLFGLAFHPDFKENGLVYTYQSQPHKTKPGKAVSPPADLCNSNFPDHDNVITEWRVITTGGSPSIDPESAREILRISHPQFNHNGGELRFGRDKMLYISVGDGGNADDQGNGHTVPNGNAQDLSTLLGKILRIDPNAGSDKPGYSIPNNNPFAGEVGVRGEIWAYGFRNPYKMSFDKNSRKLYVADVGQNDIEEIDIVLKGKNYGWPIKEGTFAFDQNGDKNGFVTADAVKGNFVDPIAQLDHCIPPVAQNGACAKPEALAIIGGFVYRGKAIKELRGHYIFGSFSDDFFASNGRLLYLNDVNQVKEFHLDTGQPLGMGVLGIGQDANGELYVLGKSGASPGNTGITDPNNMSGIIQKLVPGGGIIIPPEDQVIQTE